jgi:hypothetical protein
MSVPNGLGEAQVVRRIVAAGERYVPGDDIDGESFKLVLEAPLCRVEGHFFHDAAFL